jgi:hypothetical protein
MLPVLLEAKNISNVLPVQIVKPVFSNKFPISDNRLNPCLAEGFYKTFEDVYTVCMIGIAAFLVL